MLGTQPSRWALALLACTGLAILVPGCSSVRVEHPGDVELLLAESQRIRADGFEPVGEKERVRVEIPEARPYRLGVGDVVYVSVPGQEQFVGFGETAKGDVVGTRVKEDGNIYLPLLQRVPAAGRTPLELQSDVQERLRKFIPKPFVSVDMVGYHSQRFFVLGEVGSPGVFPVDGHTTLLEAITVAGGPVNGDADLEEAYLIRAGEVLPLSVADVVRRGDISGNLVMEDRDLLFVPRRSDWEGKVYVLGEVQEPGVVPMGEEEGKPRLTLAEAISRAGGLNLETAAEDQIRIFRGGWKFPRAYTLSSHEIYKYGESLYLQSGDRVIVAPTGLATWGRALKQGLPFLTGATSAIALAASAAALAK